MIHFFNFFFDDVGSMTAQWIVYAV